MVADACVLREISVRQMCLWKALFHFLVDPPAYNAHLCGISIASALPLNRVLLVGSMNQIMTGFTERDEVIRTIATRFSAFDMVYIQNRVFGFAEAPLAAMNVSCQDILAGIPEPQLWPFLIANTFDLR